LLISGFERHGILEARVGARLTLITVREKNASQNQSVNDRRISFHGEAKKSPLNEGFIGTRSGSRRLAPLQFQFAEDARILAAALPVLFAIVSRSSGSIA